HSRLYAHALAVVLAFTLMTYLVVILGEVVPKAIALQRTERVALAVAAPMDFFMTLAAPFLAFMTASTRTVLQVFGMQQIRPGGVHSLEELKLIVSASGRLGILAPAEEGLIQRALDLENITVREIMVPRPDIFSLPSNLSLEDALQKVVDDQHSRIPVYDPQRGPEHIIGVLYAKDLMRWLRYRVNRTASGRPVTRPSGLEVRHIMREVLVAPETKPLPDLLAEFKQRKRHLAVVVDEFGSTAGLVTVEDVLEQLVGEIEDEFDVAGPSFLPGAPSMVLEGSVNIRDLESQYHIVLPRDEGFETLAGFVLSRLQRIPKPLDSFEYEGRRYTVASMDGLRVESVKVEAVPPQAQAQASSATPMAS
ncbi:MAG TPA: hemolysin family protein, partial [Terriglobales bacterium]|nr:hemolysin family protein [Terriglobales bacterium]